MNTQFKTRQNSLTIGSLWKNIWQLSWPMFLIMILNFLVGFTDVYVAGFLGPDIQAAVGFISQIYFLTIIVANAISIGTIALISRAAGSDNPEEAMAIARQSLLFSIVVAVGLTSAGFVFSGEIISVSGFPAEIRKVSVHYLEIFALALGPNYILIISNAIFRATGEVIKPLLTMLIVSAVNIMGNFVLVFGIFPFPELGYAGIAVASAISVTIGMIVNLLLLSSGIWRSIYSGSRNIKVQAVWRIIKLSWPAAFLQIAWNAGSVVLYNILGRLDYATITALASITNGLRIEAVIYLPAFALNMAASVLIGQNLGAGNPDRAERLGWKISLSGVVLITVIAIIIFIWAERFASAVTKDPAVLEETTRYLRINMLSEPFMALSVILGGGLQGAGDTKGTMWVIIIAMWCIRLPLAYFLAITMGYGATGVWIAMVTSMNIQGMLMTWRFHKGGWKRLKLE